MSAPPPYSAKDQYPSGYQQNPAGQYPQHPPQQVGQYPPQQGQYPPQQPMYPPQQPMYPPPMQGQQQQQQQQQSTTVITAQPAIVPVVPAMFYEMPVSMTCPSCRAQIVTAVYHDVGTFAWLLCLIMFFFGFWICMFIPFCVDSCKDAIHHCPNCSVQLGVYRRM